MKNASTALKLTLIAACVITEQIVVDPYSEASAKKVVHKPDFIFVHIGREFLFSFASWTFAISHASTTARDN